MHQEIMQPSKKAFVDISKNVCMLKDVSSSEYVDTDIYVRNWFLEYFRKSRHPRKKKLVKLSDIDGIVMDVSSCEYVYTDRNLQQ